MVKDLTQLSTVFSSPRTTAARRLSELKNNQGTYRPAPVDFSGQDTVVLKALKPEAEKPAAAQLQVVPKTPRTTEPSSFRRRMAEAGVVMAATLLGGMLGGGPLVAILAGAGAVGLILGRKLANAETPNRIFDSLLSLRVPAVSFRRDDKNPAAQSANTEASASPDAEDAAQADTFAALPATAKVSRFELKEVIRPVAEAGESDKAVQADAADAEKSAAEVPETADARELAKSRLKQAILAASLGNEGPAANAFAQAMAAQRAENAGFSDATARLRIMSPEQSPFKAVRLTRLRAGNHQVLESSPVHNLVEPVAIITLHRNQANLLLVSPDSAQPSEIQRSLRLGKALRDRRQSVTEAALDHTETVLADLREVMADHDIRPENVRVILGDDLEGIRDTDGQLLSDRLSDAIGLPVEVLDKAKRADLVFTGTVRNQGRRADRQSLVMDFQPGAVAFALGKG